MGAIKRGDIYHRYFTTTKPPKYKFFVIVGEDEDSYVGYFFINSAINPAILRNQRMLDMQMPISPTTYPFLDHSSFIAGHQLSKIRKNDLIVELYEGTASYKGKMTKDDMSILLEAALQSPLFSAKDKKYFEHE
jgi:hypothetical protein